MNKNVDRVLIKSFSFPDPITYIEHINDASLQAKFTEKLAVSRISAEDAQKLGKFLYDNKLKFVVFSASWCKDCQTVIPLLAKINQIAKMPMQLLGDVKVNLQKPPQWHSPPSPPEINELDVKKIPAILVLNKNSKEIVRMYEQPPEGKSLEKYLVTIIQEALEDENLN